MSNRCKACDSQMTPSDYKRREITNPALSVDLCGMCYSLSEYAYGYDDAVSPSESAMLQEITQQPSQVQIDNDY